MYRLKTALRHSALALVAASFIFSSCKKDQPDELSCNDIETTTTLGDQRQKGDGVDYSVGCIVYVRSKLIIEAGTTIEFGQGAGFIIEEGGSIEIRGTASKRVLLRSEGGNTARGGWAGIQILSNDASNSIEYAEISGAGGAAFDSNGDLGNVIVNHNARLSVRNTTFSNGAAFGLNVLGNTNVTLANLSFRNNLTPIQIPASQAHKIDAASNYSDNDNQRVEVYESSISEVVTWQSLPVPYYIVPTIYSIIDVIEDGGLTIQAGADLQFAANTGIGVYGSAYLRMEGSSSQNVSLRGMTNTAGSWKGVYFESNNTQNSLNYVNIVGAGSGAFNSNNNVASVVVFANAAASVTNCNISNGLVCGIYTGNNVNFTESNNTFSNLPSNTCTD